MALLETFEVQPPKALRHLVHRYRYWEEQHSEGRTNHFFVPEHLTSLGFYTYAEEAEQPVALHYIRGLDLAPDHLEVSSGLTLRALTVEFFPWGLIKLLSQEGTRESVPLIQFDARFQKLKHALEHLLKTRQLSAAIEVVDEWLMYRLKGTATDLTPAIAAAQDIIKSNGQSKIDTVAASVGVSRRQLERGFEQDVGFTPKLLSRLVRFEASAQEILRSEEPNFAQIAFDLGFSDQAHLIREFRQFGQITPLEFSRQRMGPESS